MHIYPPAEEVAAALQEIGKREKAKVKGKEVEQHKFPYSRHCPERFMLQFKTSTTNRRA
jgi:hypothetical protein